MKLREKGVGLEQEDDASGFLGVNLGRDEATGIMDMKKIRLINRALETLGLDDGTTNNTFNPSTSSPLVNDAEGSAACGSFSYIRVVGMLLYLSIHTCTDIFYTVNCCARYIFF